MADEALLDEEVQARTFWSGTITFGLVSIPVSLLPGNRSDGVAMRMLTPDGVPVVRRYFCPKHKKELDWDEIVRGYEVEKGEFVVVTDDELERLAPEKTRDIDLRRFVNVNEIDPIYFERAYYLTPAGNSTKAYRLLAQTMEEAERAGIATFVMRGKEYLVAIIAEGGILRAETMRFADEVRTPDDVGLPEPVKPKPATVKKMETQINKLARRTFSEDELVDESAERLLKLVAKKEKSGKDVIDAPADTEAEPEEGVIDLMEVLKRSLQSRDEPARAGGRKRAATKKRAAVATTKKPARKGSGGARKRETA
jgi:DNA end-binding protein Ku